MVYVAVVGVWLIAGSQDVGGFRWYFITLTSPFLIKSRPTLSLRWVTSSICICICVCMKSLYSMRVFAQHHLILLTRTTHTVFLQAPNVVCRPATHVGHMLLWKIRGPVKHWFDALNIFSNFLTANSLNKCATARLTLIQHHVPAPPSINDQANKSTQIAIDHY